MNVRKMVDTMAYAKLKDKSAGIQHRSGADWATGSENMINDLIDARKAIRDFGYQADTVVMSPELEATMLKNKDVRDAFRENNTDVALLRGYIGDFMGLSFIVDENFEGNDVVVLQRKVIGDIADAEALRTKAYNEDANDRTIVRATRFTQAYLTDPKAVFLLENVIA
jgi:hypothetical protein